MKIAVIETWVMGRNWITQCTKTGNEVHCYDANPDILAGKVKACIDPRLYPSLPLVRMVRSFGKRSLSVNR